MATPIRTWVDGKLNHAMAISPDGGRIAVTEAGSITIWDVQTGQRLLGPQYLHHRAFYASLVFSPNGQTIASATWSDNILALDTQTGHKVMESAQKHNSSVPSVTFSPDNRHVISGSWDETIRWWDARTGEPAATPIHVGCEVNSVAISPDGEMIVSGCENNAIKAYEADTGHMLFQCIGHASRVNVVMFFPTGRRIASGSNHNDVRIWDRATGQAVGNPLQTYSGYIKKLAFSPNGKYIVTGSSGGYLQVWDAYTGVLVTDAIKKHVRDIGALSFTADGMYLTSGSLNGEIKVWDVSSLGLETGGLNEDDSIHTQPHITLTENEITGTTSLAQIIQQLEARGCANLTDELDLTTCSEVPISSGGFGDIYQGKLKRGTLVAIKTVRLYISPREQDQKHIMHVARELYTWSKCQHPNVQFLLGLVLFKDQIGMVARWESNGSMPQYLERHPNVDRCVMSTQIATGISYLHSMGVVHGDLKGANILISEDGIPRLADFGNAKLDEYTLKFAKSSTREVLSSRWAAPEIFTGSSCNMETDVYALGMTILEAVTGDVPWVGKSEHAVMFSVTIIKATPERPEAYIPTYSEHGDTLWQLLKSCWEFEPGKRPSAEAVKTVIKSVKKDGLQSREVEMGDADSS